jgi:RimJ/RimL family protein N-acetyltransferase
MHEPEPGFDQQPVLEGPTVMLRPLCVDDFDPLYAAASDPLIWEQHPDPLRYRRANFTTDFFEGALAHGALVVIDRETQRIIGSTRYYEWDPVQREVAIGYTFLARSHWGGEVNKEMKRLQLEHAFRFANVVWFHIGKDNLRSRRAIEKIGARLDREAPRPVNGVLQPYAYYRIDRPRE